MPTDWSLSPNPALAFATNYTAYFRPYALAVQDPVDYGHRARSAYVPAKYLLWQSYGLRGLLGEPNTYEILMGSGMFLDRAGPFFNSIYEDKTYDDASPLFPSTFALACNENHRSQTTKNVDAFFRRLHQEKDRVLENCHAISCALPLACRTRPTALLSFMRHIVLFSHNVEDVGAVEIRHGADELKKPLLLNRRFNKWLLYLEGTWYWLQAFWNTSYDVPSEPHTTQVTLPLPEFSSFHHKLYGVPPASRSEHNEGSAIYTFMRASMPLANNELYHWDEQELRRVEHSSRSPTSPFTRLIEEIFDMRDRDQRLSFLKVVWLEKLLAWKMSTFGLYMYLTRTALPMLVLFIVHLVLGVLLTENSGGEDMERITAQMIFLAYVEAMASGFVLSVKVRQLYRIPRIFVRSIFNYVDGTAICLGFTMFFYVGLRAAPSRPFLGFSTLFIWTATILTLRIYRPVGMLLLLLTETLQGLFSFLVLLFFIILGLTFVPYLILRNLKLDQATTNPFSSFPLAISQMLNFISSDYNALEPFEASSTAVRILRALYITITTVFLLNILIAMLNLKIKSAEKNATNLYHLQMASLQVEIELGMLSSSERARRDWFPEWFSYSMTETEKRAWNAYVENNPLKWTEENSFNESKDNVPPPARSQARSQARPQAAQRDDDDVVPNDGTASAATPPDRGNDAEAQNTANTSSAAQPSTSNAAAAAPSHNSNKNNKSATLSRQQGVQPYLLPSKKPWSPVRQDGSSPDHAALHALEPSFLNSEVTEEKEEEGEVWTQTSAAAAAATSRALPPPPPPSRTPEHACKICAAPAKLCMSCRTVAYCGKEHQRQDWRNHKSACKGKARI